jgi:hexulose-6-phosphate isomerase
MDRREFLAGCAVLALTAINREDFKMDRKLSLRKAVLWDMLPGDIEMEARFQLAKKVGFAGVQAPAFPDLKTAEQMKTAADNTGMIIHSVIYGGWEAPLTSADQEVANRGMQGVRNAIDCAVIYHAGDILLVPGIVNAGTRYMEAWQRSHDCLKKLVPYAEKNKVEILIEEVWNNFLLSPLEFVRYVDELKSPWLQAFFDVGNVVAFGWPEDWIRTLGHRIRSVHLKDYKGGPGLGSNGHFCALGDGSINWPEVRKAFKEIGYAGWVTTELAGGDEAYLRDVSQRVDRCIEEV